MYVDNENLLVKEYERVLQKLIDGFTSAIDIGCGTQEPTKNLRIYEMVGIDLDIPDYADPKRYIKGNALEILPPMVGRFDVSLALDFLEHLTEAEGSRLIHVLWEIGIKRQIYFIPTGDKEKVLSPEVNPDHKTYYTPDQFERWGFQIWHCPNFHETLGIGAFLTWKTFDQYEKVKKEITVEEVVQYAKNL
jgi:hypothetical protein